MSAPHLILAIDPSLANTGLCLMDLYTGKFKTRVLHFPEKVGDPRQRNVLICNYQFWTLKGMLQNSKHNIRSVVIEDYAFAANTSNLTKLAELGGVLRIAAHQHFKPVVELTPGTWKKIALGKGNLKKPEIREAAEAIFPQLSEVSQDEVDATMLAYAVYLSCQSRNNPNEVYKEFAAAGLLPVR